MHPPRQRTYSVMLTKVSIHAFVFLHKSGLNPTHYPTVAIRAATAGAAPPTTP
jgi:hypothetical protein